MTTSTRKKSDATEALKQVTYLATALKARPGSPWPQPGWPTTPATRAGPRGVPRRGPRP